MPTVQRKKTAKAGKRPGRVPPPRSKERAGTAAREGDVGVHERESIMQRDGTPGRPRTYETPEDLLIAVEAYFGRISRTVDVTELVDSGQKDADGHVIYVPKAVTNDEGEVIRRVDYLIPPSVTDLCLELGITRQTWINYRSREGYRQVTEWAKARIESYLRRESLTRTKGLQGVIFNLEQNFKDDEKREKRSAESFDMSAMTDEELLAMVSGG